MVDMTQGMKRKTLHMIGNGHIDPVWLWQWTEGFHEVKATFRSALDRMTEYEDFVFVSSSAVFYEWVEQSDPAMFREIQERVAERRWEITGGWWLQPDCNVPGGESYARQGLYGQRYFQEKFGRRARVGYNVDSFGHNGMLPQILKLSGLDYYVFTRPGPHEKGLPNRLFWWVADDGSRVLAFRIAFEYGSWGKELDKHVRRCAAEIKAPFDEMMCFYGVGNHGGGPTRENIESILRLNEDPELPRLLFSTPERYFAAVEEAGLPIPVVHDELQRHASGTYAAHSAVKRWNRTAENRLLLAEKWSAIASRHTGQPYAADFERGWKNVLFNQFHDILAGTSLPSAYDDAAHLYGEAMAIADRALNLALQSIVWRIKMAPEDGEKPIVVFNPHAWEVRANVELEFGRFDETNRLLDDEGEVVPVQFVQSEATAGGRNRLSLLATLPPLGYRVFRVVQDHAPAQPAAIEATDTVLDNGRIRLEIDPQTGAIASLRDLRHGVEVFEAPAARALVLADESDTWSHNIFRYNEIAGEFRAESVRLVEHGPVKSVIRVRSRYGESTLIQDFTLYAGLDRIDVHTTVDWRERFKVLKLRFPVNVVFMRTVYEIPYGHKERFANGEEEPGQSWVDISGTARDTGERYGLSLLNDGKYSFDSNIRDLGLTVLRSPIYAHHIPAEPLPDATYQFIDQGVQRFTYALLPHAGGWEEAGTVRQAAELNQKPVALVGTTHEDGTLPWRDSFVATDSENIVVSVLKQAEEGEDLILRCYETARAATTAKICLPHWGREIEARFRPCEIKSFRIPRDAAAPVVEVNILEEAVAGE
jgi:alpha-mannosidase